MEGEIAPSFTLRCLDPGRALPDGWGIGYYPGGEPAAAVLKEPAPPHGSIRSELVQAWEHLATSLFVLHIRHATWGANTDANTQPFHRSYAGRDWLFCHAGSLHHRVERGARGLFEPVGSTDTEQLFCELLCRLHGAGARSLSDLDPALLLSWFHELNQLGSLTSVITDGNDLCAYVDGRGEGPLYLGQLFPPYEELGFADDDLDVDLSRRGIKSRKGIVLSTATLAAHGQSKLDWQPLSAGTLLVVRQGAIVSQLTTQTALSKAPPKGARAISAGVAPRRRYRVQHRTVYSYERPVERSRHILRLTPVHDRSQSLLAHSIHVSVDGKSTDYDDVFGNRLRRVWLEQPYTRLEICATSEVEVRTSEAVTVRADDIPNRLPLVWMPWQRHMLLPYFLPSELPESQLGELGEYAESFARRNDHQVLETLQDLNLTLHREYRYEPGSTTLYTTPFDIYERRRGVCQDFTNLFLSVARLLGLPARYSCGYIYTGPKNPNHVQSEASHAWAEVYLPLRGWVGFDPTNGLLVQTDHVRVAVGRNYVDATPTSGTLYVGGGPERLEVGVTVEPQES